VPVRFASFIALLFAVALASLLGAFPAFSQDSPKAPETLGEDQECAECHGKYLKQTVVHKVMPDEACDACHEQDGDKHSFETSEDPEETCLVCHDYEDVEHPLHSPVQDQMCLECHDPHASKHAGLLRESERDTCLMCHEDVTELESGHRLHGALGEKGSCLGCHHGHGTGPEALLRSDTASELCANCHGKVIKQADGRRIAAISEMVKKAPTVHGPVAAGECLTCHAPHASEERALLTAPYPDKPYREFSEETYELCFQCHDVDAFESDDASGTEFRHGDRNLHALHVNRSKGRTCRMCHDPHATKGDRLIREGAPFGKWTIPLGYKKTATGGSCASGCHVKREYQR
jgi:predicted CXXCH cytochrome family protein